MKPLKLLNPYDSAISIAASILTIGSILYLTQELVSKSGIYTISIGVLGTLIGATGSAFLSSILTRHRVLKVFISYTREDKEKAEFLKEKLRERGIAVKSAEDIIRVGDNLFDRLEQGISESDYVVLVLSGNSKASSWIDREVKFSREKGKKIFPVLAEDVELPKELVDVTYADMRTDPEHGAEFLARSLIQNAQSKRLSSSVA